MLNIAVLTPAPAAAALVAGEQPRICSNEQLAGEGTANMMRVLPGAPVVTLSLKVK